MQGLIDDCWPTPVRARRDDRTRTARGAVLESGVLSPTPDDQHRGVRGRDYGRSPAYDHVQSGGTDARLPEPDRQCPEVRAAAEARIHIGAQWQASAGCLTVRDNGIGIDPQFAERIFHDLPAAAHAQSSTRAPASAWPSARRSWSVTGAGSGWSPSRARGHLLLHAPHQRQESVTVACPALASRHFTWRRSQVAGWCRWRG